MLKSAGLMIWGAALLLPVGAAIAEPTFPSGEAWMPVEQGGLPMGDVVGYSNDHRDLIGDGRDPGAFFALDSQYLYFRLRVDGNPSTGGDNYREAGWAVQFDTDLDLDDYEIMLIVDGMSDTQGLYLYLNTVQQVRGFPQDPAELLVNGYDLGEFAQVELADTSFDGDNDYFVDWAVPLADLASVGLDYNLGFRMIFGSTEDPTFIGGDLLSPTESVTLVAGSSDVYRCLAGGCGPADSDGDGISDGREDFLGTDPFDPDSDNDGLDDGYETQGGEDVDSDGDTLPDALDDDSDGDGLLDSEEGDIDTDFDGTPDYLDLNSDGDPYPDESDPCPTVAGSDDDTDEDGLGDDCDPDIDGDGIDNVDDNCPDDANEDQEDVDNDNIGDECDDNIDTDSDGIDNGGDNCPLTPNSDQTDTDGDGVGDACDLLTDSDGDTVADEDDNCPTVRNFFQLDFDGDDIGNACDDDDDNDGFNDDVDNCPNDAGPQDDTDGDGLGDICDPLTDRDNDGVADDEDNCPDDPNLDQLDADGDDIGNACDPLTDRDGDGVADDEDNCPNQQNVGQEDADFDGLGDICDPLTDRDGDGVADDQDNCPAVPNPGQENEDGDAFGDVCDDDGDNDGVPDNRDNCPEDPNGNQADFDQDGVGDVCDPLTDLDEDGIDDLTTDNCPTVANGDQSDLDGDGEGDACDIDDDDDGVLDTADNCPEDANSAQLNLDGDDEGDACDDDDDGDEIDDEDDNCPTVANADQADLDDDDEGDACDGDVDGDDVPNGDDNCPTDANGDQIDLDEDGVGDVCDDFVDQDDDGVADADDGCPTVYDPDQADLDQDGEGDACDGDVDGDTVPNGDDNCPIDPNGDQADGNSDGEGDVCDDSDGDGTTDNVDNCPADPNEDQADFDDDGVGDACEDSDDDGFIDADDNCPGIPNEDQGDFDQDSLGDVCDPDSEDGLYVSGGAGIGGCSTAPGQGPSGLWAMALGLLALRRRRWQALAAAVVAVFTGSATTASAQEQEANLPIQQFQPIAGTVDGFTSVYGGQTPGHLTPTFGLYLNHAWRPLVLTAVDTGDQIDLVRNHVQFDVTAALGIGERFQVGVAMPVTLMQTVGESELLVAPDVLGFGLGDTRLSAVAQLVANDKMDLAGAVILGLPTGEQDSYLGDPGLTIEPRLALGLGLSDSMRAAFNLGYMVRTQTASFYNVDLGNEIRYGAGLSYALERATLYGELHGRVTAGGADTAVDNAPLELNVAVRLPVGEEGHAFTIGGGPGLVHGYGSPRWRTFVGYTYRPVELPDTDGDGIVDRDDRCPEEPEDFDEFQDDDGCPELDNDGDGILDVDDACVNQPEDVDSFEDEDGCPDADNDNDGIADGDDQCPMDAEDTDNFEDEDGCPETDNDGDGFLDTEDQCPNEAEIINSVDDDDGCPDEGKSSVRITETRIEILEKVYFDLDKATIQPRSYNVLDQVAATLRAHKRITLIRVEGHTDTQGDDAYNLGLSQMRADAVRTYLMDKGIDGARLQATGYGETRTIAPDTDEGNAKNRRVEFHILQVDGEAVDGDAPVLIKEEVEVDD